MSKLQAFRYVQISLFVGALAGLGWSSYEVVHYLRTAPRFEVQKLAVSGLKRVDENLVLAKAGFELGTNVFAVDLDEIRQRVEELRWVRYAIVQRVLPDQILVKVIEREPIGVARIRGEIYQFDVDAAILDPDPVAAVNFPVLDGLRIGDMPVNSAKVKIYQTVVEELGQSELSEIHVNDAGEVSVVSTSDALLVSLGREEFRNRWIKYLQLKPQIQQKFPNAVRVDLRFKNQVIVRMKDDETGEMIVWDAERKAL
jgi:cell division protein FtsQ